MENNNLFNSTAWDYLRNTPTLLDLFCKEYPKQEGKKTPQFIDDFYLNWIISFEERNLFF